MLKKNLAAFLLLCLCFSSFAQSAPQKVLSARDVDAFITNHVAIETELDALGDAVDQYFDIPGINGTETGAPVDMAAAINHLRATKAPAEIQEIMKKNGLGDNGFEKYIVISYSFGALYLERMLKTQSSSQDATPDMKQYMDQAKASVDQMKSTVDEADLSLVSDRFDDLTSAFNERGD